MEIQSFASREKIDKTASNMVQDGPKMGLAVETFATEADISSARVPLHPINAETRSITKQLVGTEAPLDHTPQHDWDSHSFAISPDTRKQSE